MHGFILIDLLKALLADPHVASLLFIRSTSMSCGAELITSFDDDHVAILVQTLLVTIMSVKTMLHYAYTRYST